MVATMLVATPAAASASVAPTQRLTHTSVAKTLITDGFQAGNIISDAVFFDSDSMTSAQIDAFIRGKAGACRAGYVCLKDYRQSTENRGKDNYCNGYTGARNETAAAIIAKAAQSCGINPQVLLVMLQKEQSLITHTWPSTWRYTMALGQGCPDTAPCDSAYAGFFHQIYGAARQMKIYTEGRYFTYYAPGKTWNIYYNPNFSCGTAPVTVKNKATSALYYYTPYQPNAAALRAGYGSGDSCSAYGNRNFHNYFTDWFGSTQASPNSAASLLKSSTSDEVYLISGNTKHHITTGQDLAAFSRRLGNYAVVSQSKIDSYSTGIAASRLIRDARDGAIYLLEPDGSKHHFPSVASINAVKFDSNKYTPLTPNQIDRLPRGTSVGSFIRAESSGDYYRLQNGSRHHIGNQLAWRDHQAAAGGYVAVIPDVNFAAIPRGRTFLASGTLVKETGKDAVYIVGEHEKLVHIASFDTAADVGIREFQPVPAGGLSGFSNAGTLTPIFRCEGQSWVADGGNRTKVTGGQVANTGLVVPDSVCTVLPKSNRVLAAPILVKPTGADPIYSLESGTLRHLQSAARLYEVNGNRPIVQVAWSNASVAAMNRTNPYFRDRAFVSFSGEQIYFVQGSVLRHVTTPAVLMRITGGKIPTVTTLPAASQQVYKFGDPITK